MGRTAGGGHTSLTLTVSNLDLATVDALPRLAHEDADWERAQRTTYLIRQSVRYVYPGRIEELRQRLLLVPPRRHGDQHTIGWGLDVSQAARRRDWKDRFGNMVVSLEVDTVESAIDFEAWSLIERRTDAGRHRLTANKVFAMPTPLTTADRALAEAADELAGASPRGIELGERICEWVHRNMAYRHDVTSIQTTAAEALAVGAGVCQDYAHIALALCRRCALPARYVSGHLLGEGGSHAWIEVMVADPDRPASWHAVPLDPTHNRRAGLTYLTIATGRDYRDAAPTSGSYQASAPTSGTLSIRKHAALVAVAYRDDRMPGLSGRLSKEFVRHTEPQFGGQPQ